MWTRTSGETCCASGILLSTFCSIYISLLVLLTLYRYKVNSNSEWTTSFARIGGGHRQDRNQFRLGGPGCFHPAGAPFPGFALKLILFTHTLVQ